MHKHVYMFLFILFLVLLMPNINSLEIKTNKLEQIEVEVKGEVENPDVFVLPAYSTLNELLQQVNLTNEADLSSFNLTMILKDHDVIVIPKKNEKQLISINSASIEQLISIPNIGEVLAGRIVDYRNKNGPFQKLEDIMNVKGIGKVRFEQIKDYICL